MFANRVAVVRAVKQARSNSSVTGRLVSRLFSVAHNPPGVAASADVTTDDKEFAMAIIREFGKDGKLHAVEVGRLMQELNSEALAEGQAEELVAQCDSDKDGALNVVEVVKLMQLWYASLDAEHGGRCVDIKCTCAIS